MKIGIIKSTYNSKVTDSLEKSCIATLVAHGIDQEQLIMAEAPGAFELPLLAQEMTQLAKVKAVICLGCVIKGETSHFDFVCNQTSQGILQVSLESKKPVIFGVLTTETYEQALDRSAENIDRPDYLEQRGKKLSNKGQEAALAALKMLEQIRALEAL